MNNDGGDGSVRNCSLAWIDVTLPRTGRSGREYAQPVILRYGHILFAIGSALVVSSDILFSFKMISAGTLIFANL